MLVPPGFPDGAQRQHGLGGGVAFELASVVGLGHLPQGFYCVSEAVRSVLFPSGQPSHSHHRGRGDHTRSVKRNQRVIGMSPNMINAILGSLKNLKKKHFWVLEDSESVRAGVPYLYICSFKFK